MEQRRLGRTEHLSSVVAFGGAALWEASQADADAAVQLALEHGINHFDVAPQYGKAEVLLGPWMPRIRQSIFLGCKTLERTRQGAHDELRRSLERLQTGSFDLYQFHSVGDMDNLDRITSRGGALEAVLQARDEGLIRHVGITGHGMDVLRVQREALRRFPFDTLMFPLNLLLYTHADYRRDYDALMEVVQEHDIGTQILKTAAKAPWAGRPRTHTTWYEPLDEQSKIQDAVNFVLSQPVTTLCATGDLRVLPKVIQAAEQFRPLTRSEQQALLEQTDDFDMIFAGAATLNQ